MDAKLKSGFLVQAILRLYDQQMRPAALRRRGDPDSGSVIVKIALDMRLSLMLTQARDGAGNPAWLQTGPADDADVEAAIAKAVARDPDLWVIEAEDPRGKLPFEAVILK